MTFDPTRRLAAEGLGAALLVAIVVGSGVMAESLTDDVAVALLANTAATATGLIALIVIMGPISGAHFNPAVTLVFALRREIGPRLAVAYVAAQIAGGALGAILAHAMFARPLVQASLRLRDGPGLMLAEGVATFGLVAVILAGLRFRPTAVPALVGLWIASAYWFTASTSFANPAVTVARALTDSFSGIAPASVPAFVLAQLAGAVLAWAALTWLLKPQPESAA
jgi:glycerol uptake facilitator-like aquaporin